MFTVELGLAAIYFARHSKDRRSLRWMVALSIFNDVVCVIAASAHAYMTLVPFVAPPVPYHRWPYPVLTVSTGISAFIEQTFLTYRFYKLSENRPISSIIFLAVSVHTVFTIYAGVSMGVNPSYTSNLGVTAVTVAVSMRSVVDILIPLGIVWQLRKADTSFASTKNLVRRISVSTISSGTGVALMGLVFLGLFWSRSLVFDIFCKLLGRLYSITILVNLLLRKRGGDVSDTDLHLPWDTNGSSVGTGSIRSLFPAISTV
ncbi:hypothetical protein BD779DRAFT_1667309 [Infundibulicybe gibba]|nr:hypothetical protein BD779DRAFT_1667309 [Infundibulicybe gibba]